MEENRKRAYRRLLYYAMVELRSQGGIVPYGMFPWWNIRTWANSIQELRHKIYLAEWVHNLAQFCAEDGLDAFSEARFWDEFERFKEMSPKHWRFGYREQFETDLEKGR